MSTGSVINRGKDTWLLQVYAGSDWQGKYKRYTKTVHGSKSEAKKELAKFYAEVQKGNMAASSTMTVEMLINEYIEESASRQMKRSSFTSVKTAAKIWIIPFLGKKKLNRLRKTDIQKWVNGMSDGMGGRDGVKPKTVKNYYSILSGAMEYAIDMDYISINPCRSVRLPRREKIEREIYSPEELEIMLQALEMMPYSDIRYKVAVQLGLWGGCRKEEICGFNRDDIDFEGGTITVNRARLIGTGVGVYEDTTKTQKSMRTVCLPKETMADIKALIEQQEKQKEILCEKYNESSALIRKDTGEPLYPQVLQRWFRRFCEKNGIRTLGLHALRHTHASILNEMKDVDSVTAQLRMGHSELSTTLNIYTHQFHSADERVAKNISEMFYEKEKK